MSKISIEQQIAELTPEQRNAMGNIYKKYVISLIVVFLLGVLAAVGMFVEASIREGQANDELDKIQTMIALNEITNKYDFSLFDESSEALDEYYDAKHDKNWAPAKGSAVSFFGVLIVIIIFKKKYPYFSEKKYTYLKKAQKTTI